jgi:hypothetical protein
VKRFLIPAFFVVDGDDDLTEQEAERRVAWIQAKANEASRMLFLGSYLMLDENLPNKEVPALDKGYGLPGSYTTKADLDIDPATRFRLAAAFREATGQSLDKI